jgi:hypothetical protein
MHAHSIGRVEGRRQFGGHCQFAMKTVGDRLRLNIGGGLSDSVAIRLHPGAEVWHGRVSTVWQKGKGAA